MSESVTTDVGYLALEEQVSVLKQQLAEARGFAQSLAEEFARYHAASAGMPKLRRMKVSADGSKPFSVELYNDDDVKALRARCVALEAKMQETAKDAERYAFWKGHPRSTFVIWINESGNTSLKMDVYPKKDWDKAFTPEAVDVAIDYAIAVALREWIKEQAAAKRGEAE